MTAISIRTFAVTNLGGAVYEAHDHSANRDHRVYYFTRTAAGHMVGWRRNYDGITPLQAIFIPQKMTAAIAHAIKKHHAST